MQSCERSNIMKINPRKTQFPSGMALGRKAAVVALALCIVPAAFAVSPVGPGTIPATYDSGTASNLGAGTEGTLELSSSDALIFHDTAHGKMLSIPYKTIVGFEYTHPVTHHLGILPTIVAALVSARQRQHIFTITYTDDAGKRQIALFEVPGSEPRTLLPLLRARTDVCPKNNSLCGGSLNYNGLQ